MSPEFLRNSVKVRYADSIVMLEHSFWEITLPREWVESTDKLQQFFARQLPATELDASNPELQGLLQLLRDQGCLSFPNDRESYKLKEVQKLFINLSAQWYGQYYAHPLWKGLREGSVSRNALTAWLVHNYHVSRSAGMSDARCATKLLQLSLRPRFAYNAIEEYSHCDEFYFVRHPNLFLSDDQVKDYIHLPSSLAFDYQMLRMAEDDWLGHVLVSFFQESTVRFLEDCKAFYQVVERNYNIEGFFSSWQRHIELDLEYEHASKFALILSADDSVLRPELIRSLRNARFTFEFLINALSEILLESAWGDRILLRLPIRDGLLDPRKTALLAPYIGKAGLPAELRSQQVAQLYDELRNIGITTPVLEVSSLSALSMQDMDFLRSDITLSIYKALSYSDEHDLVVLFGCLAQDAMVVLRTCSDVSFVQPPLPKACQARALANFLNESATKPALFAFLLLHLAEVDSNSAPLTGDGKNLIRLYLERLRSDSITRSLYATRLLQLNEYYVQARTASVVEREYDFFYD